MATANTARINRKTTDARAMAPPVRGTVITPTATADNTFPAGSTLWVGVAGNISGVPWANVDDTPVLFKGVAVGHFKVRLRAVLTTNTTATDLVALS